MHNLTIVETILRNRGEFFNDIRESVTLITKIKAMLVSCFLFLAIYGAVMGASTSLLQAASSFIKLPFLFLATLIICTPSLHFFNILFGSRQTLLQTITLILTAMTTTSVLLLSFAPVTLFFLLTSSEYQFFKLLNVFFFALSGVMGIAFLRQRLGAHAAYDNPEGANARRKIFILWVILYGFVGSQMAWTLRPFMGIPGNPFILFEQIGGNFYSDVLESIRVILGYSTL
jgi:hypothetical protein